MDHEQEFAALGSSIEPLPAHVAEARVLADGGVTPRDSPGTGSFISSASGLSVHTRSVPCKTTLLTFSNRAADKIFVLHGLNDHSNKHAYTALAHSLSETYDVHLADMQGHGYSGSHGRQYVPDFREVLSDTAQWVNETMA